jgi:hypothetical protein
MIINKNGGRWIKVIEALFVCIPLQINNKTTPIGYGIAKM